MSAPVLVSIAGATLALALPVVAASAALDASARAAGAADSAALAAADAALGWVQAEPCEIAARVADAARASLVQCDIDEAAGRVRVGVSAQTFLGGVHARARAGPP